MNHVEQSHAIDNRDRGSKLSAGKAKTNVANTMMSLLSMQTKWRNNVIPFITVYYCCCRDPLIHIVCMDLVFESFNSRWQHLVQKERLTSYHIQHTSRIHTWKPSNPVWQLPGLQLPPLLVSLLILQIALRQPKLKYPLLDDATEVCDLKNHQWIPETWWWNEHMDEATQDKITWLKTYRVLKGGKTSEAKEAETTYNDAKHVPKPVVWLTKSDTRNGIRPSFPWWWWCFLFC